MLMVDPKRVELTPFNGIPHLITPVIVDTDEVLVALKAVQNEMFRRYKLMEQIGVRNFDGYNSKAPDNPMPYLVIIIDELADLMMVASKDVEDSIMRLAQMARAVGIHLILATQRPSVDVLTGIIKANFPSRISFRVAQKVDSRTILDQMGAQQLLGKGDMLFIPPGTSRMTRVHGPLVTTEEITEVVEHLKAQGQPVYDQKVVEDRTKKGELENVEQDTDELFDEAVRIVVEMGKASTSTLQRRLRIGYGRAARLLDIMERDGIVGPPDGSKPREVLKRPDYFREMDETRVE
jgi:S-DNA-T family DNA segregation ATPase FtsK/SpoIIIE